MKAVVSVIGNDQIGILALIANECAQAKANVLEVSQTILNGIFTMTMIIDIEGMNQPLTEFATRMEEVGKERNLVIKVMHQDIFDSMHKI